MARRTINRLFLVLGAAFAAWTAPATASLDDGLRALQQRDYPRAIKELRPLAEAGDLEAQYRIGRMYEFGAGYPKDVAQAVAWYRKAADKGYIDAMQELGVLYATGDGVPRDDAQSAQWFRKAAEAGNPTAQYNLGLLYAKGSGVKQDNAQAIAWWRKSAMQGMRAAQFKLGVAYENGEGVARDPALAYASYAIAAQGGNADYAAARDAAGKALAAGQRAQAQAAADAWRAGDAMPTTLAGVAAPLAPKAAVAGTTGSNAPPAARPAANRCSATGSMEGEKFTLTNCAVSLMQDAHSVAIWFNEDPITPAEVDDFALSSNASDSKAGRRRTLLVAMFCPGGGAVAAAPAKLRSLDLNTSHARSALAGIQTVVEAPKELKVEKLAGNAEPGAPLSGRITGAHGKTTFTLDFDVTLPARDAAAGLSCK